MKKFMVIYRASDADTWKMKKSTPKEHKEGMKKWMEWAEKCGDGLVDIGSPLGNGQKVDGSGNSLSDSVILGFLFCRRKI